MTEYTVRYRFSSGNGGDRSMTVSQDSTNTDISGLTIGETYTCRLLPATCYLESLRGCLLQWVSGNN